MIKKKVHHFRIRRIDIGAYQVEEQYRVLFLWKRWRVGSRRLKIQGRELFSTAAKAAKAIQEAAALKGIEVQVTDLEAEFLRINRQVKDQVRTARKQARKAEERERNLRRIRK